MNSEVVKARYFREKLALDIQKEFPEIVDDYRLGIVASQIESQREISKYFSLKMGRNINSSILMALSGFKDLNGNLIEGLIPKEEYKTIASSNIIGKGVSFSKKQIRGLNANRVKFKKKGLVIWSDEEKYFIKLAMGNAEFRDSRRRIKRSNLTFIINEEFHNSKPIRSFSGIKNIMYALLESQRVNKKISKYCPIL